MTNITMPNNTFSMIYVLKSVPGLADVGVPHGDGPQDPIQMSGEVRKKFQVTNLTMPNNSCSMKYALKSVPGHAEAGVPHGDEDGPVTLAPGSG